MQRCGAGAASAGCWVSRCPRPHGAVLAGSKQYSAAIAFTLALFSHLINHVNIRLQAELEEGENPVPAFRSDGAGRCGRALPTFLPLGGRLQFVAELIRHRTKPSSLSPSKESVCSPSQNARLGFSWPAAAAIDSSLPAECSWPNLCSRPAGWMVWLSGKAGEEVGDLGVFLSAFSTDAV